jgi:phosphatidylinositol alpha-1,6-mannosyltransferase
LKVLFITRPIVPPWNEGSKNMVLGFAENLEGHEIHLLSSKGVSIGKENVIFEDTFDGGGTVLEATFDQKLRIFLRLITPDAIDLYHFVFTPNKVAYAIIKLVMSFRRRKPKIVQTVISTAAQGSDLKKIVFADYVVAISRFMEKKLIEAGVKNVIRIPAGIDVSKFKPLNSSTAKVKFGFGRKRVVLYPGRYLKELGAVAFLQSARNVISAFPETIFVFACRNWGKSAKERETEKMIKDSIKEWGVEKNFAFLGEVDDIKSLIAASEAVVFVPESMESKFDYPLVLIEAMAMKKPIIISNIPPLNELVEKSEGIKVSAFNSQAISSAIISLFSNKNKALALGEAARNHALKNFDIRKSTRMLADLYNKIEGDLNG